MKKLIVWLRAVTFNIFFYALTVMFCIAYLPALILPRRQFVKLVVFYMRLMHLIEKYALGLDYEVRGYENLPDSGSFLVAAKHFSAYETLKLHLLLDDPAVILKKELIKIPLWGWYAKKADMIAIDRSNRDQALKSIAEGAQRMQKQGRPIVIFPQGTRIHIQDDTSKKPYRTGLRRMYETTGLPVIPLALNSGVFWPRNAFIKRPGTVIFEFGPPIEAGLDGDTMSKRLEADLEPRTKRLLQEARTQKAPQGRWTKGLGLTLAVLALIYSCLWYAQAAYINSTLDQIREDIAQNNSIADSSALSNVHGFPGKPKILFQGALKLDNGMQVNIPALTLSSWLFTGNLPLRLSAPNGLSLTMPGKGNALEIDKMRFDTLLPAKLPHTITAQEMQRWHKSGQPLKLRNFFLKAGEIRLSGQADIHVDDNNQPSVEAEFKLSGAKALLEHIGARNIVSERSAVIVNGVIQSLSRKGKDGQPGYVKIPVLIQDRRLYVSGLPVARVPRMAWRERPDRPQ